MELQDLGTLNRLVLVKQLHARAADRGRSTVIIAKVIRMTSLDHAVEMLLEGVVQALMYPLALAAYPAPTCRSRLAMQPSLRVTDLEG